MNREHALDAFPVGNAAHGESLVDADALAADHDPCKNLDAFLVAFHHAGVDPYAVAHLEAGDLRFKLLLFDFIDDTHNGLAKILVWKRVKHLAYFFHKAIKILSYLWNPSLIWKATLISWGRHCVRRSRPARPTKSPWGPWSRIREGSSPGPSTRSKP